MRLVQREVIGTGPSLGKQDVAVAMEHGLNRRCAGLVGTDMQQNPGVIHLCILLAILAAARSFRLAIQPPRCFSLHILPKAGNFA